LDRRGRLLALYTVAIGLAAGLVFLVQPMIAKILLPRLGGSPAVWSACMVFFQAMLLLGYLYAHVVSRLLTPARAALAHTLLILLPLLTLPLSVPGEWVPPTEGWQAPWVIGVLSLAVGAPYVAVASASPLLQRWFAATGHPHARDPYFLYSASNLGSVLALCAYPLVLEPLLPSSAQSWVWATGYLGFVALVALCAVTLARGSPQREPGESAPAEVLAPSGEPATPVVWTTRLRWMALAFVPSSLVLGVTHHLSTDIAAIPFLWVAPLALYLVTFIVAFARKPLLAAESATERVPLIVVALALAFLLDVKSPIWVLVALHLLGLGVVGLACHSRLACERPPPLRLTEFYLLIALGGVLGGSFNALAGPLLFDSLLEYPIVLVAACMLRLPDPDGPASRLDRALDLGLPVLLLLVYMSLRAGLIEVLPPVGSRIAILGVPALLCFLLRKRRLRFALGVAVLLGISHLQPGASSDPANRLFGRIVHAERTFFGVHRVAHTRDGRFRAIFHGNTVHGLQHTDPARRGEALVYFHRAGPLGSMLTQLGGDPRLGRVAVLGLGCGSLAAYARTGQRWSFFEIDPAVERIADEHFTFLTDARARGAECPVVIGDGRLLLDRTVQDGELGVVIADAFASDSIPLHLISREALQLYLRKVRSDGLVVFNISNRYIDLTPVLAALAADQGLAARTWLDPVSSEQDGIQASHWVVMARSESDLARVLSAAGSGWEPLPPSDARVWTDDFSNLLSVLGST